MIGICKVVQLCIVHGASIGGHDAVVSERNTLSQDVIVISVALFISGVACMWLL